MVQREKILVGCVIGAAGLLGGVKLVQSQVIEPRRAQIAAVIAERERRDKLETLVAGIDAAHQRWYQQTQRTISADPAEAHKDFFEDIGRLTRETGLTKELRIRKRTPMRFKDKSRKGFVELPLAVSVKADLPSLVAFLQRFHELPYQTRVTSVTISPEAESAGGEKKRKNAAKHSTELSVSIVLSTLVLPRLPELDHPLCNREDPPDPSQASAALAMRKASDYDEIARLNVFQLYHPPPPEPPPDETPKVARTDKPQPAPPADPRKGAEHLYLKGTVSLNGVPIAYVADDSKLEEEPKKYHLNDRIDDGRLVLIHHSGIVVQTSTPPNPGAVESDASRSEQHFYYYPFRKSFKEREPLTLDEDSELARLVRAVLDRP
ncbi:MAG: hypothetical protein HRF50_16290 [Phycisphaerae bacterium]|jgi:hypothetical protein